VVIKAQVKAEFSMSSPFCISLAKPTPVHFQHRIPDRRPNSDHSPHKTGVASTDSARKPEQLLHPFLPQFADPKIERQYRDARLENRLTTLKVTITAGVFISMVFAALDLLTLHDASLPLFYVHIIGTVTLLVFLAAASLRKPNRWIELLCFGAMITQIVLLTTMLALSSSVSMSYYQPTELWIALGVASFVVCGGSFVDGLVLALCTVCAFFASVTLLHPEAPLVLGFHFAWLSTTLGLVAIGTFVLDRMQHLAWWQARELLIAEEKIRSLLHNVLPPSIAARKLAGESVISDRFSEASVLFADLVDFTPLSAQLESTQVVNMLNDLFSRFDRIVARHGLEKIKTIGDCYMAVGGIPHTIPEHLNRMAEAALQMLDEATQVRAPDGTKLAIRIGMHTGPVCAGVIGESKFIFDVWGDTVNVASRMESHGAAGRIQVTEAVHTALLDKYHFAGPMTINVKGKGPSQTWFLSGRRSL
jgi:adenylate cyclase